MRVLRGRAGSVEEDRAVTGTLAADVEASGEPTVRAWTPHRQVAFGRRDARSDGYERAKRAAEERGFPTYERGVGGRAVAYTWNTVAFVRVEPVEDLRRGTDERYDRAVADLRGALRSLGGPARSKLADLLSARADLGRNFAIVSVGTMAGSAIAPPMVGGLIEYADLRVAFLVVAGITVLAAGVALAIVRAYGDGRETAAGSTPGDD